MTDYYYICLQHFTTQTIINTSTTKMTTTHDNNMILFFKVSKNGRYRMRGQWISRVLEWFPSLYNRHAVIFSVFLSNCANLRDLPPRDCLLKVSRPASFVAALALTHRFSRLSSVHGRSKYHYNMYIIHLRMRSHIPRYTFITLI